METKATSKILSGIAAVLCAISVFLPWFMHTNDVHPYSVLEMAEERGGTFAAPIQIAVTGAIASALVMFLFAFRKKRVPSIMAIGIPVLSIVLLIVASIVFIDYDFFPVYGPTAVLIATVLHFISVFRTSKKDTTKL